MATVDPLVVNLLVVKGIPSLADLDLTHYQQQVNLWTHDFATRYLPHWETVYKREPQYYQHNPDLFKVGLIAQYIHHEVGVTYHEAQKEAVSILYLNPAELFLNGVLDSLQGTCGNMAAIVVAIAWRMGWPVSLACLHSHFLVRHDDGTNVFNIEATAISEVGFCSSNDEQELNQCKIPIPPQALRCGSELKALTSRERFGAFLGLRARHYQDMYYRTNGRNFLYLAERGYLLARYLFPAYRHQICDFDVVSALTASERFEPYEAGHPATYGKLLFETRAIQSGTHPCQRPMPPPEQPGDSVFIRHPECQAKHAPHDNVFESLGSTYCTSQNYLAARNFPAAGDLQSGSGIGS